MKNWISAAMAVETSGAIGQAAAFEADHHGLLVAHPGDALEDADAADDEHLRSALDVATGSEESSKLRAYRAQARIFRRTEEAGRQSFSGRCAVMFAHHQEVWFGGLDPRLNLHSILGTALRFRSELLFKLLGPAAELHGIF